MMIKTQDVLFHEQSGKGGDLGIITLNRPQALNSLNAPMMMAMSEQLRLWSNAKKIKAVVIQAVEGRAFCAGGDIKSIYEGRKNHQTDLHLFFREEYQLNKQIYHFPKPYIALLNGITMGGGVGISLHGSHRVATDNLVFAMPETGIGFFPDVGGTYFLPRLPHYIGYYLGLTGARISSDDCVALQLAQYKVSANVLTDLAKAVAETSFAENANETVSRIIGEFAVPSNHSQLLSHATEIADCFWHERMANILQCLQQKNNAFCHEAVMNLSKKSPTSLKITLRALQIGKALSFDDCMQQEYRLVNRFLQGHDFIEGIRALLIDKDQKPDWQPSTLSGVTDEDIKTYFAPLDSELA